MTFQELRELLQSEIPKNQIYTKRTNTSALNKVVLRYKDIRSDKFWQCECFGSLLMVNYGKWETTGRYDLKEFSSYEECQKQAQKLINSKKNKGYSETNDFEEVGHCYFDDENIGISPITSNPIFRKYCSAEFYYDCTNDYAPFGNDNGNDILFMVQKACRTYPRFQRDNYAYSYMHNTWEMPCITAKLSCLVTDEELVRSAESVIDGMSGAEIMLIADQVTIAAVLGKFKIKGMVERFEIFQLFRALDRMERLCKLLNDEPPIELFNIIKTIREDMYCYDQDRYAEQYYSLTMDYDDFWYKEVKQREKKGRFVFNIPKDVTGHELAEKIYRITEDFLHGENIPVEFENESELYDVLGSLYGEAVCNEYNWSWMKFGEPIPHDNGFCTTTQFNSIVSPNKMYSLEPHMLIRDILEQKHTGLGGENDNTILLLFHMLETIDEQLHNTTMKYLPIT